MIRVAIVGLGGISAAHIQAYLTFPERCRIVALVDIVPEKARKRAEEYGISCDILDDHHLLLDRRDIDLVDICTPPYVHAEISVNCLRAGMNVLCEKPWRLPWRNATGCWPRPGRAENCFPPLRKTASAPPSPPSRPCWTAAWPGR